MTMKIKNWKRFQHYKERRPPWIKLHREILDDDELYDISGDDFRHLVMLWLIASEDSEGNLPPIKKLAFRLRISQPKTKALLNRLNNWIILDASTTLDSCLRDADPETEAEVETESESEKRHSSGKRAAKKGKSTPVWEAYQSGYLARYGIKPKRNAKQSTLCCQLIDRLGIDDAVGVAEYYPSTNNAYHVGRGHALSALIADAEKFCTEWKTGHQITASEAREKDRLQKTGAGWDKLIRKAEREQNGAQDY